jgi:hypothetical protein
MSGPDLNFAIEGAEPVQYAVSPHIAFRLKLTDSHSQAIHSVILKSQIQLDVTRRRYSSLEQRRLADLFGEPQRWGETLRGLLWMNTTSFVPGFTQEGVAEIQVPCTFDFNIAATKYFAALEDDEVPLSFFFNGTIFYARESGGLQVAQISWDKEASYRMPVRVWREMMDAYYPNTVWLALRREAFERLNDYKIQNGLTTFEDALLGSIEPKAAAQSQ